jgi:hypothetical protein
MFIIFFNFGLNFKLKFLTIYVVQKAFEFGESFSKPAKFLLYGFHGHCAAAFQKRKVYRKDIWQV